MCLERAIFTVSDLLANEAGQGQKRGKNYYLTYKLLQRYNKSFGFYLYCSFGHLTSCVL